MSSENSDGSYRNPVEELAEEFVARHRRGEQPAMEDYIAAHPDLADQIRSLFPAMVMMERIGEDASEQGRALETDRSLSIERVGDFRIVRELGRGGMGIVYEAEQESLGRRVALKVMLPSVVLDSRQLARFEREARSAARLHHTNIVPVHGVGRSDHLHYFVMQLIDGQGLDNVLVDLRRLRDGVSCASIEAATELLSGSAETSPEPGPNHSSESQQQSKASSGISSGSESGSGYYRSVARLGIQAAEALHYAHDQGVMHRDVKPSNLLLDSHGTVWVTDFGLAKEEDADDLTLTGDIVGTLRYMAPERFDNECTAQSDLYGLGLTLYELLTMRPAYDESDRAALVARVLNDAPPPPRKFDRRIPRDLETIVLKAIARDPRERYTSSDILAQDLRRFLDDRPILARRARLPERAWRWCRRNPAVAFLTTSVVILLVGVTVAYLNTRIALKEAHAARQGETEALSEAKKRAFEAEAAERDAAQAVDDYFTQVSENKLLGVPGMEELRRDLLTLALRYYEKLSSRSNTDSAALKHELAVAHERVGMINSWIGSAEEAIRRYREALRILESLRESEPDDHELTQDQARCHWRLAIQLRVDNRLTEAEQQLDSAIAFYDKLADGENSSSTLIIHQANAYSQRGIVRGMRQQLRAAIEDCEHAIALLGDSPHDSPQFKQALANAYDVLGNVHADEGLGNFADAVEPYRFVADHYRGMVAAKPHGTFGRRSLARALHNLGRARFASRDVPGSLALFEEALALRRQLYEQHPGVGVYQSDLINSYDRLARVHSRIEKLDQADEYFAQAIRLQTDLSEKHPEVGTHKRSLTYFWCQRGYQQQRNQDQEAAQESYRNALEIAEQFVATVEPSADNHRFIAETYNNVGEVYRTQRRFREARQHLGRAVEAARALASEFGNSNDTLHLIGTYTTNLGNLETEAANLSVALDHYRVAINSFTQILAANEKHGPARLGLYSAHRGRATAFERAGKYQDCAAHWEQARKIAPPEHTSYVILNHGKSLALSGQHQEASVAAEQLLAGDSLKFYFNLPKGPATLKHLAGGILAASLGTVGQDESMKPAERRRQADKYFQRALTLIREAAEDGLYESSAQLKELREHQLYAPLRERSEFREFLAEFADPAS